MNITVEKLCELLRSGGRVQLVDVRAAGEFDAGHVPGAVNVPMERVESRLADLHASDPIALLCQSGARAEMTCEILKSHRPDVMFVEGGTSAWVSAGLPVVQTSATRWSLERQVRLIVGSLGLLGFLLAYVVSPWFLILPGFFFCGLTFAGLTDICGMSAILRLLPWNRPAPCAPMKERKA